jgi:hypothetical protein
LIFAETKVWTAAARSVDIQKHAADAVHADRLRQALRWKACIESLKAALLHIVVAGDKVDRRT